MCQDSTTHAHVWNFTVGWIVLRILISAVTYLIYEEACNGACEDVVDWDAKEGIDDAGSSTNLRSWGCLPVSNSCDGGEGKKE